MDVLDTITHLLIYEANGWLLLAYGLARVWPAWASLGALLLMLGMDRGAEAKANQTPAGPTGSSWLQSLGAYQAVSLLVFVLWLAAALLSSPPVPLIGTAMWWIGALAAWFARFDRSTLLWRAKTGIGLYALAALGFALYGRYTAGLSPEAWAAMLGGQEEARAVLARGRAYGNTLAVWGLWLVLPLGYFSLLLQRILAHPLPLVNARAEAADIINIVRTRGRN